MQKTESAKLEEWRFEFGEGGLSPSTVIDALAEECKLFRPPTIVFGSNFMELTNEKHNNFKMVYNPREALKFLNFEVRNNAFYKADEAAKIEGISYIPKKLQIKHAEKWKNIDTPK